MNLTLLLKVKQHILEEPRRLNMNVVLQDEADGPDECGTVGCIGGWAIRLAGEVPTPDKPYYGAAAVLDLTREQAYRLFMEPEFSQTSSLGWPQDFADRYQAATTPEDRAEIAAERIDHFILTEGRE